MILLVFDQGNDIDPMRFMTKDTRDVFPKLSLEDNGKQEYIGDGKALNCVLRH